jgi:hypothetical protein
MWASKLLGIIGGTLLCSLLDYVGHVTKALHPLLIVHGVAIHTIKNEAINEAVNEAARKDNSTTVHQSV